MIEQLAKRWLSELEADLDELSELGLIPIERFKRAMKAVGRSLKRLKAMVMERGFADREEEINFFKVVKPKFYQWKIYYAELYNLELGIEKVLGSEMLAFLESELLYVDRFFGKYAFVYEYYRCQAEELDGLYFVRGADSGSVLVPEMGELDTNFATGGDYLFSKFRAMERIRDWLVEHVKYLTAHPGAEVSGMGQAIDLRWTGESINLAELAFGIHRSGQLNNGTATVGSIFRWLEGQLGIAIGVPSKRLNEIRKRTATSRTKFLEKMAGELLRSLDGENKYTSGG